MRQNRRGYLIIALLIIGYKVIYPAFIRDSITMPITKQVTQDQYIYITVPAPTLEPLPTYTPYPTQTPQAPQIVYTSDADTAYRTWTPRLLMWVIIGLCFWIVYNYYQLRRNAADREFELEMAKIEVQAEFARSQVVANTQETRPLIHNVHRGNGDEKSLVTAFDKKIPHSKVKEFIENVDRIGLSINQWRQEMMWVQQDIEDLLDHLEAIQLINSRSKGSAATWRREVDKETLARMLGIVLT